MADPVEPANRCDPHETGGDDRRLERRLQVFSDVLRSLRRLNERRGAKN